MPCCHCMRFAMCATGIIKACKQQHGAVCEYNEFFITGFLLVRVVLAVADLVVLCPACVCTQSTLMTPTGAADMCTAGLPSLQAKTCESLRWPMRVPQIYRKPSPFKLKPVGSFFVSESTRKGVLQGFI